MSEPTKFMPDEAFLKDWAADHAKGSTHPFDALAAEVLRLRAELAKAKRALERAGFVDKGGEEWAPPLGPSASPLLDEIDRLRSELAKASAEVQRLETAERLRSFSPPKPHQFTGSEALAPSYEASQAVAKDAPPADVLGERAGGAK